MPSFSLSPSKKRSPLSLNPVTDESTSKPMPPLPQPDSDSESDLESLSDASTPLSTTPESSDCSDSDDDSNQLDKSQWMSKSTKSRGESGMMSVMLATSSSSSPTGLLHHSSPPSSTTAFSRSATKLAHSYVLANLARQKLTSEVERSNRSLRMLVGHANFLDAVVDDIRQTEIAQASWFDRYPFFLPTESSDQTKSELLPPPPSYLESIPIDEDEDDDADAIVDDMFRSQILSDQSPSTSSAAPQAEDEDQNVPPRSAFSFDEDDDDDDNRSLSGSASRGSTSSGDLDGVWPTVAAVQSSTVMYEDEYYDEDAEDSDLALCRTVSVSPTDDRFGDRLGSTARARASSVSPIPELIEDEEAEYAGDDSDMDPDTESDDDGADANVIVGDDDQVDAADKHDVGPAQTAIKSPTSPASPTDDAIGSSVAVGSVLWSRRRV